MQTTEKLKDKGTLLTVFVFTFISVAFILYGFFLYFTVGTHGKYSWYFGIVEDVPGASRYSTSTTKQFIFNVTSPEKEGKVTRQHVMGENENPVELPDSRGNPTRNDRQ